AVAGDGGLVAVRACVVAGADGVGEDGATDAFAGMTESFLYVRPEEVPERVARCWASGFSPASILYRARKGLSPEVRVAVGVQAMVPGVRSFVAFSRDPRTGAATCVIAAAHGIGENVVQERADIDHYFVETGEIRAETVGEPVLSDAEVREVAGLAGRVEAFFGPPQDLEGTITSDGVVHLMQARPVVFADRPQEVRWSNHNITESFPGVSGALTYSQARIFYRLTFADLYRRMGVPERRLRRVEHHLGRMVGLVDGRVYYRLDAWFALHGQMPGFPLIRRWWERSMGIGGDHRPSTAELLRALPSVPSLLVRLARQPRAVADFLRWWDHVVGQSAGIEQWPPERLIAFYRRLWAEAGSRWGITLVNTFFLLMWATLTSAALRRWVTGDEQRLLGGLLMGGRENRSLLGVRSALALAELAASRPDLADRIRRDDPAEEVWADLGAGRHGAEVARAAAVHLSRYGDRALHDLKLEEPSPRQRPGMIITMIKPMVHGGLTVAGSRAKERAARAEAERELRERCPSPARRLVVRTLVAGLRRAVAVREDARYCRSQLYGLTRQVMWRLGDLLAEAGRLDHGRDVVDLTVEEVLGAYDGTLVDADLRALVRARREERRAAASRPDPGVELSTPLNRPMAPPKDTGPAAGSSASGELRGLPSSRGVVRGEARVVLDPSVSPESCRDRIIVAKETDPGWLFLMMAARGMVVERGTLLSHTAITGRLLGIPTVVAVPRATTLIKDGDLVEIDGAEGSVRVVATP
ncbi:PEP/pyruvate-binding domain-containing protein, partial [Nonomuraea longicatena]|uniref:PEP/pyruvate-binding domain-containing protein n=1 Tax=Nonomuraea longicatena TaxID=83682 RepID=UPI0031DE0FE8